MSLQKSQERLRNQTKQLYDALDSISTPIHEQDPQEVIKSIFNAKLRGVGKGREENDDIRIIALSCDYYFCFLIVIWMVGTDGIDIEGRG